MATANLIAPILTPKQIALFWSKVAIGLPDECWPWIQNLNKRKGYGKIGYRFNGAKPKYFLAHILARFLTTGEWPNGLCTLHHCDNPACCNPAHLWLGTNRDNTRDMISKGRDKVGYTKGEASGRAKLTESQVLEIRRLHATGGITLVQLGKQFGVHPVSIRLIVKRINWTHI